MNRILLPLGFSLIYGNIFVWTLISNIFHVDLEGTFWNLLQFLVTSVAGFILVALYTYKTSTNKRTKILVIALSITLILSAASIWSSPYLGFERPDLIVYHWLLFGSFIIAGVLPISRKTWASSGIYSAFVISFFAEMYGFPVTLFILSSFLGYGKPLTLVDAHLLAPYLTLGGVHIIEAVLIVSGVFLLVSGWKRIYSANGRIVTEGLYKYLAHPQYVGILLITGGMLIEYPTFPTVLMWFILLIQYYRIGKKETAELVRAPTQ